MLVELVEGLGLVGFVVEGSFDFVRVFRGDRLVWVLVRLEGSCLVVQYSTKYESRDLRVVVDLCDPGVSPEVIRSVIVKAVCDAV